MPDSRTHRGPYPQDGRLFAADMLPKLRRAAGDLNWLLSRDYPLDSALKLVGDRFSLVARQRTAVRRSCCSDRQLDLRRGKLISGLQSSSGGILHIDGYNLLTTVEAALAGGVILAGRDGCYRDMASMHGNYRKVAADRGWAWRVELVTDPDPLLSVCEQPVATADSFILDNCEAWRNLAREVVENLVDDVFLVNLGG